MVISYTGEGFAVVGAKPFCFTACLIRIKADIRNPLHYLLGSLNQMLHYILFEGKREYRIS